MILKDIDLAIKVLKECQYCWADQVENEGEKIADYDAISQSIRCLEGYRESERKMAELMSQKNK